MNQDAKKKASKNRRPNSARLPYERQRPHVRYEAPPARDLGRNALDWIAGCALIYGTLFGAGKVIFKDYPTGALFLAVALAAGLYIYRDLSRRGWKSVVE